MFRRVLVDYKGSVEYINREDYVRVVSEFCAKYDILSATGHVPAQPSYNSAVLLCLDALRALHVQGMLMCTVCNYDSGMLLACTLPWWWWLGIVTRGRLDWGAFKRCCEFIGPTIFWHSCLMLFLGCTVVCPTFAANVLCCRWSFCGPGGCKRWSGVPEGFWSTILQYRKTFSTGK